MSNGRKSARRSAAGSDSYNYFGRDPGYLGEHLLPLVKRDAELLLAVPGMVRDCHDGPPACLLASWTPEQLDYMHDNSWWQASLSQAEGPEILGMHEMAFTREAWAGWIQCDNEHARGDRHGDDVWRDEERDYLVKRYLERRAPHPFHVC